jgi:hypothetical protein
MDIKFDAIMSFPASQHSKDVFDRLAKYMGSVEDIERNFGVEFSCGDGKFLDELWQWSDNERCIKAVVTDEEMEKYEGNVCLESIPRFLPMKMSQVIEPLKAGKDYRFTIKYSRKTEEEIYYINSRERSRKWIG